MTATDVDGHAAAAPHATDFQAVSLGTEVYLVVVQEEPDGNGTCLATVAVGGEVERAGAVQGVLEVRGQHRSLDEIDEKGRLHGSEGLDRRTGSAYGKHHVVVGSVKTQGM